MKSEESSELLRIEKSYWTHEMATHLNIGKSTLNKWARELEKHNYIFLKDESDKRAYTEHDAIALRKMKEFLSNKMSLSDAAKAVSISYKRNMESDDNAERAIVAIEENAQEIRFDIRYQEELIQLKQELGEQKEMLRDLIQVNHQLVQRLDEKEKRDQERDEIRDRNLVNLAREIQESRQLQIAATKEEEKTKSWWKFWK